MSNPTNLLLLRQECLQKANMPAILFGKDDSSQSLATLGVHSSLVNSFLNISPEAVPQCPSGQAARDAFLNFYVAHYKALCTFSDSTRQKIGPSSGRSETSLFSGRPEAAPGFFFLSAERIQDPQFYFLSSLSEASHIHRNSEHMQRVKDNTLTSWF